MSALVRRLSFFAFLVPVAGVIAVGCHPSPTSTMQVRTNSAVVQNVANYRTYSHETAYSAPAGYATTNLTPEVLERVRTRIDIEMMKKGYVFVPSGELVVRISSGVRTKTEEPRGSAAAADLPAKPEQIGALVVDIFDRENDSHLFHGYAKDEIHTAMATDEQISTAVSTILAPLPSRMIEP